MILQKSNIAPEISPQGSFNCNKSNCGTCPYLQETSSVNFNSDKGETQFKLLGHFSWTSSHVFYKITCISCTAYYIRQVCHVREHVSGHEFNIFNVSYCIQKFTRTYMTVLVAKKKTVLNLYHFLCKTEDCKSQTNSGRPLYKKIQTSSE